MIRIPHMIFHVVAESVSKKRKVCIPPTSRVNSLEITAGPSNFLLGKHARACHLFSELKIATYH